MSKIQDAIRKIQSSASIGNKNVVSVGDGTRVSSVAKVIDSDHRVTSGDYRDDVLVTVDRTLLRKAGLLAPEDQQKYIGDQYRLIKRPLLKNAAGLNADGNISDRNLIMVASALSGDGKTFTCINLALSMAIEKDTTVLLVDADVAKPHLSQLFGIATQPGIIDILENEQLELGDVILRTDVPGLWVLSAGQHSEQATELLASRRMGSIVSRLSRRDPDRVVIFDSPPLLATSEAPVLASFMGQISIVVCAGKTSHQAVTDAISTIDESKAVGLILNQASPAGFGNEGYGGYYGSSYGSVDRDVLGNA